MRDAVPIAAGYFAVAFSLGIAARNAGVSPLEGFVASLITNASAGEYAGFSLIGAGTTVLEMVLITFIINARYLLMGCALSQRCSPELGMGHRLGLGFYITDEVFAVTMARPGFVNPNYVYGCFAMAAPFWSTGTALGCLAGDLMPAALTSAFSVALYGMFLAVVIPPARKSLPILAVVAASFALSAAATYAPLASGLSPGTRTIVLTVLICSAAAIVRPVKEDAP
ncbi:MAG: AzlC family ABC transporter permease [Duodenibacillus sp.]|nr:AzlC family ABC transporter permease [Duodenibacillus sp.]